MLYVNGCSLTYGMELGTTGFKQHSHELTTSENLYRETHNWPGLVSTSLNCQLLNDGISGATNDRIFRTTIERLTTLSNPTFVIIGWTSLGRLEVFDRKTQKETQITLRKIGKELQRTKLTSEMLQYRDLYVDHFLDYDFLARNLHAHVIALSAYLSMRKIPYLMFSAISNKMEVLNLDNYLHQDMYQTLVDANVPIGEFMHPLEAGHKLWAEVVLTALKSTAS